MIRRATRARYKSGKGVYLAAGLAMVSALLLTTHQAETMAQRGAPVYGYRIVNAYPHDAEAFTQGLVYRDGYLFESTGRNGHSSLRKVKLDTGEVVQQRDVDRMYFAEGLTDWGQRLIQLTWQSNLAFVYDIATFATRGTFGYSGEGWGLTHDGHDLILSDGSETLRFFDPETFRETRRLVVRDGRSVVRDLNELEYVRGEIYANVWHTDRIARISPATGQVTGWVDLSGLLSPVFQRDPEGVLNGIAYDSVGDRLFVTGKLWPKLFEIAIGPRK